MAAAAAAARFPAGRYLAHAASGAMTPSVALVSPEWLAAHLGSVTVLDASWQMPAARRSGAAEHAAGPRIPGSVHFCLDTISDTSSSLPHMLPSPAAFGAAAARLGISHARPVVVYNSLGLFSSPRVWWTLRAFGHQAAAVLDGGLPAWLEAQLPVEVGASAAPAAGVPEEAWALDAAMVADLAAVSAASKRATEAGGQPAAVLVDARSSDRFTGDTPEPREGLRSGHMPGSCNLPFGKLIEAGGTGYGCARLLGEAALAAEFEAAGVAVDAPQRIITTCGSGVTAAVLTLALVLCGRPQSATSLYDGSWAEWGSRADTHVVTGRA